MTPDVVLPEEAAYLDLVVAVREEKGVACHERIVDVLFSGTGCSCSGEAGDRDRGKYTNRISQGSFSVERLCRHIVVRVGIQRIPRKSSNCTAIVVPGIWCASSVEGGTTLIHY